jgi:polyisoprenoid-binding protein YceI
MITTVTGHFRQFDLKAQTETDGFTGVSGIEFTADVASVDTNNAQRDAHLRSADFFDGDQYPQLRFVGTKFTSDGDEATLQGDLTIKGVTRPVSLDVEMGGIVVDPYGQTKAGFTVNGKISRKEFGLTWSAVTEAGQVVVGDEIKIHAEVQLVKQAEPEMANV